MRVLRILVAVFSVTLVILPGVASADTLNKSGTITIHAEVAPSHTIVVDDNDRIFSVQSNTSDPTDIFFVYRNEIDITHQISITPGILTQYQVLVSVKPAAGVLYQSGSLTPLVPSVNTTPLYLRLL